MQGCSRTGLVIGAHGSGLLEEVVDREGVCQFAVALINASGNSAGESVCLIAKTCRVCSSAGHVPGPRPRWMADSLCQDE